MREEFDVQLLRAIHRDRKVDPQFVLGVAQALKWEGDERPVVYAEPQVAADVLARIRAARQHDRLRKRAAESLPARTILGKYAPWRFAWMALDKDLLLRIRNGIWELGQIMPDVVPDQVDRRILEWWQRKAERVNFYWHHLLWVAVLWALLALSETQHAFPWNLRGTGTLSDPNSGSILLAIALPLGLSAALCYEWMLLRWQTAWARRLRSQPLFVYGWPAAMFVLAGLAVLNPYSPVPLRWILGPLNGAVLLWAVRALDFRIRSAEALYLTLVCAAFGLWAWWTFISSDLVLAMLTGVNMLLLLRHGRGVLAGAVEQYGRQLGAAIWTYGWLVPLAALVSLSILRPADLSRNPGWVFACWLFTMWGMLATPFHIQRCAGCLIYGSMGAFVLAAILVSGGKDDNVAAICSVAFALLLGGYLLVDVAGRARRAWRVRSRA